MSRKTKQKQRFKRQPRRRTKPLRRQFQQRRQSARQTQSPPSELLSLFDFVGYDETAEALYRMPSRGELARQLGLPAGYDQRSSPMRESDLRSDAACLAAHKINMQVMDIVDARFTREEWETEAYHRFFFRTWLRLRPDGDQIGLDELCRLFQQDKATIQRWKMTG